MNLKNNKKLAKDVISDTLRGGFGVVLPTFGMFYILYLILSFIMTLLSPITGMLTRYLYLPEFLVNIFSAFLIFALCFICGVVLKTKIGKFSFFFYEKVLKKLKIYKLFNIIKEIYDQFFEKKQKAFSESVVCYPYGRKNAAFSGLISSRWEKDGISYYSVFIPTCPNFTSGLLKHIRVENVDILDNISTDKMMRTIIACGVGTNEIILNTK